MSEQTGTTGTWAQSEKRRCNTVADTETDTDTDADADADTEMDMDMDMDTDMDTDTNMSTLTPHNNGALVTLVR